MIETVDDLLQAEECWMTLSPETVTVQDVLALARYLSEADRQ